MSYIFYGLIVVALYKVIMIIIGIANKKKPERNKHTQIKYFKRKW